MFDKVMALFTLAVLTGFLGIIVLWVPDLDLGLICGLAVSACAFDFFRSTFSKRWRGK
jgi:hypothetical protein